MNCNIPTMWRWARGDPLTTQHNSNAHIKFIMANPLKTNPIQMDFHFRLWQPYLLCLFCSLKVKGDVPKQRSITRPFYRNGEKKRPPLKKKKKNHGTFSVFIFQYVNNWHLKVIKTQLWVLLYLCVTSWMHPPSVAAVYIMSRANFYLLFIGKEWTNMAAPWEARIQCQKM